MKTKRENPLKVLFSFSGEARGKMTGSVILAFIGEMFGMAPYFVVTLLAKELYEGTATVERAAVMAVTAAVCMCLRAWLTGLSSMRSHTVSFTILKNIRCALADKMAKVPMGVMLETPSGTFKTLMVDNVGRLEDIIAHMVPELPSNLAGPVFSIILVFVLDWRMGLAAFITVPLSLVFAVCMMRGYKEKMAVYLRSGNEMNAALVEYVGGIQVIKAFGQGSKSFGEFSRSVNFSTTAPWPGGGRAGSGWRASRRCSPPLYWARCPWERGSICRARWSCPCSWPASSSPSALWPGSSNSALPWGSFPTWLPTWTPFRTFSPRRSSAGLKSR